MGDPPPEQSPGQSKPEWQLPSWKKIGEFVANVMWLERSMETLKEDNRKLHDQAGELKVLLSFVHPSLRDQIDTRAERAAIGVFERLIAIKGDENPEAQR